MRHLDWSHSPCAPELGGIRLCASSRLVPQSLCPRAGGIRLCASAGLLPHVVPRRQTKCLSEPYSFTRVTVNNRRRVGKYLWWSLCTLRIYLWWSLCTLRMYLSWSFMYLEMYLWWSLCNLKMYLWRSLCTLRMYLWWSFMYLEMYLWWSLCNLRMYLWWSLCTMYLLACQVRVTVDHSGLRCCVCVTTFER